MLEDVKIQNCVGDSEDLRYERKHNPNWGFDILGNSVDRVAKTMSTITKYHHFKKII
jgi:hypothetical protein